MDSKQTQLSGSTSRGTMGGHDGRSADEIARDIAARRADMSALADALEERLAPKQLASEVSHAVKKQLQGRTHRAASAVAGSVRRDPFPWLLMGLGAAWLVKERRERANATRFGAAKRGVGDASLLGVSSYGSMGYASSYGTAHPMESPTVPVSGLSDSGLTGTSYEEHGGVAEKAHEVRERVAEKTHEVRDKVADKAHAAKERVAETAHDVREKVSSTVSAAERKAHLAKERAVEKAHRARMGLSRQYDSSPLLLGLAALVGGVVLGSALPATRKEEEVLGPVRDRLFDQVRDTGRDVAGKVSRVAEVAVHTAVDRLESDGSTRDLGSLASSAAHAASEAAKREASRQGLASGPGSGGVGATPRSGDGLLSGTGGGMRTAGAGAGSAMTPSSTIPTVPGGSGGGPLVPPNAGVAARDPRKP